jgi:hypothetical protein
MISNPIILKFERFKRFACHSQQYQESIDFVHGSSLEPKKPTEYLLAFFKVIDFCLILRLYGLCFSFDLLLAKRSSVN